MITINLLPFELRPVKRTPVPYILTGMTLVAAILIMGVVFLKNVADTSGAARTLNKHRNELATLEPVVQEYNALTDQKRQLHQQVLTIDEITSDRIIWSRQLFNLSRLALENLWYDSIEVNTKPFTETRKVLNEQTKQMETQTVKLDKMVLTVSGYVVPGKDGHSSISPFTLAMENDDEFAKMFQLDKSTFKDTDFDEVPVREFELEYLIERGGSTND